MEKSALDKDLVFLTLQFLNEEGFKEAAHKLECESGLYFNMKYFEEMLLLGKWNDAENYLSRFTRIDDNMHSTKIYFEIRKQKYLEALDIDNHTKALDILVKDLKVFSSGREELFNEMTKLLTINNIREHASLSTYGDTNSVRKIVADSIMKLIEGNPEFHEKLKCPTFKTQSLNWQYLLSKDPLRVPDMKTFLMDHICESSLNPSSLQTEDNNSIQNSKSGKHISNHNSNSYAIIDFNGYQKDFEDGRSNSIEESHKNSNLWNDLQICDSSYCQFIELPTHPKISKILRLAYTNEGNGILALASNGHHLLWKWPSNNLNPDGKATTQVPPHIWQPGSDLQLMMSNELTSSYSGDPFSSFSLSKNDSFLMSTSGGPISLFSMVSFKTLTTIMAPPPRATCLTFYPRDNNILAVGMDDLSIIIYNVCSNKIISKLEGHSKRVSDLAFSTSFDLLVSIGVNDQWVPKVAVVISQATFSSDGQAVYVSFVDGTVAILDTLKFQIRCRINLSAYLSTTSSSSISALAIAAHPHKPSQFVVGLTDGRAFVFEPRKPEDWNRFSR
ncbi:hypothetical protein VNO80_18112 [Phaseolus coccineus]|uniref:CTLH domain-containing protein n=1 Tax=Phaseolus coccineus TaxID=3886 RepID=A0AAN9QZ56_PHACN